MNNQIQTNTHTPGPWTISAEHGHMTAYQFEPELSYMIGSVMGNTTNWTAVTPVHGNGKANAALIASAPELLMALRNLQKAVTNAPNIRVGEFSNLVEDAIAKALVGEFAY
jgi:hypothetical protein